MEKNNHTCSSCGKKTDKKQPAKVACGKKWVLAAVVVLLIGAIVVGAVCLSNRNRGEELSESAPTQTDDNQSMIEQDEMPDEEMMDDAYLEAYPVLTRDNYTSLANSAEDMEAKGVTMEGLDMNNGKFSVWYWEYYYELVESLGEYAFYYGLDTTVPLESQVCTLAGVSMTWQQFVVDEALYYWHSTVALALEAKAAGLSVSQEEMTALQEQLEETASIQGYPSVLAMIQTKYGSWVTTEDYLEVKETKILADLYYANQMEALTPTPTEVSAYYDENSASLEKQGIMKDSTPANVAIRQILVKPEGSAMLAGTYSKEQMEQAQTVAEDIVDQWNAQGGTEDAFIALAMENSADTATKYTGGLYEALVPGDMPHSVNSWCFDPAREPGDYTVVETNSGVHIVYFVSAAEESYWYTTVLDTMLSNRLDTLVSDAMTAHPYVVDYEKLFITTLTMPAEDH